jgi:hypothetical protein
LLLLGLLVAPGHAARPEPLQISSVKPERIAVGTEITITGSGFQAHPRVFLTHSASQRRIRFRVKTFHATEIKAIARDAAAGTYDLNVRIGGETATLAQGIEVAWPNAWELSSPTALPGERIRLSGEFFGTRRGRVFLRPRGSVLWKRARILSWSESSIELVVPSLPVGYCDIFIENHAGPAQSLSFLFAISAPSSCNRFHVSGRIDGIEFVSNPGAARILPPWSENRILLLGTRLSPTLEPEMIVVIFTYDLQRGSFPAEVSGTADAAVEYSIGWRQDGLGVWRADAYSGTFSIELLSASAGCLRGRMSATMPREGSGGLDPRTLEFGEFELFTPWRP